MKDQKVRAGEKISYLMANIGNIPLMTLLGSFFMIYYTDVVGLDPAALATLFLISKIMDAISDPVMGFLLDKFPITKMGKFRPMLILGTIICSINYALLWFGPVWMPQFKYIIVYVTYLLLGWTFDIMDISLNSLLPVMTDNDKERNSLSLIKAVGYIVGGLVVAIGGPIIVADGRLESYYILIFGSLAIVVVFSIVGALGVHERVSFSGEEDEKYSILEMFKFMTCKPVAVTFLSSLIGFVGSQMASSAGTYFYTYVIGDLTKMSLVTVIAAVGVFPTMIISPILANKMGKRKVYIIGTFFAWAMGFLRVFAPTSLTLLYAVTFLGALGSGLVAPLGYGIQADNTMYVQYKTGRRAEAAIASLSSLVTKVGQGLGGAIPGYVLAFVGYSSTVETQPQSVVNAILACVIFVPTALSLVSALVFSLGYKLDKADLDMMTNAINNGRTES